MVKAEAAVNLDRPRFSGEHAELVGQLYDVFVRLWEEHYTSPVFAGDEMIFALGGNGYMLVFSHLGFKTLFEARTPVGSIELRPNAEDGSVSISKVDSPEGISADQLVRDLMSGLDDYYRNGPRLRL